MGKSLRRWDLARSKTSSQVESSARTSVTFALIRWNSQSAMTSWTWFWTKSIRRERERVRDKSRERPGPSENQANIMLVAFWWTLVKVVVVSQHKRQRNKSFSRFLHNLKTQTRTWKCTRCTMQMNSYASDLPFENFCKLAKRAETIGNYQKQVLVIIKHCLANSQINLLDISF